MQSWTCRNEGLGMGGPIGVWLQGVPGGLRFVHMHTSFSSLQRWSWFHKMFLLLPFLFHVS